MTLLAQAKAKISAERQDLEADKEKLKKKLKGEKSKLKDAKKGMVRPAHARMRVPVHV